MKSSQTVKTKPIKKGRGRGRPRTKILTQKDIRKQDIQKSWQIKRILNSRLRPKTEEQIKATIPIIRKGKSIRPQFVKEYLIEWAQTQESPWENTWEPQDSINIEYRLEYLLNKKREQRKQKKLTMRSCDKNLSLIVPQKNLTNVVDFKKKERQRINKQQKKQKNSKQKYSKNNSSRNYVCYLDYEEQFALLVQNFLKGKRNTFSEIKEEPSSKSIPQIQSSSYKQLSNLSDHQPSHNQHSSFPLINQQQQLSNNSQLPYQISSLLIKSIEYHSTRNQTQYFKISFNQLKNEFNRNYLNGQKVNNNNKSEMGKNGKQEDLQCLGVKACLSSQQQHYYIAESDLVRYFPYEYQKYLMRETSKEINFIRQDIRQNRITMDGLKNVLGIKDWKEYGQSFDQLFGNKLIYQNSVSFEVPSENEERSNNDQLMYAKFIEGNIACQQQNFIILTHQLNEKPMLKEVFKDKLQCKQLFIPYGNFQYPNRSQEQKINLENLQKSHLNHRSSKRLQKRIIEKEQQKIQQKCENSPSQKKRSVFSSAKPLKKGKQQKLQQKNPKQPLNSDQQISNMLHQIQSSSNYKKNNDELYDSEQEEQVKF